MMNGMIVRQGDKIGRFEVLSIEEEKVTLKSGEELFTLRLPIPDLREGIR